MSAKKPRTSPLSPKEYRKELEYLYARKTTVDTLIESLEHYSQFREKSAVPLFKGKSA